MRGDYLRSLLLVLCCFTQIFGNELRVKRSSPETEPDLISDPKLPSDLTPNSYILHIKPNIVESTFSGKVKINITCLEPTNLILLHAHQSLRIPTSEVKVTQIESSTTPKLLAVESIAHHPKKPHLEIHLTEKLNRQVQYEIELTFSSDLQETADGLFKGTYTIEGEGKQYFIATYLRPNNARRLFPCFDEPGYKVPFDVSIARPKTMKTLFNTELSETIDMDDDVNYVIDHFKQTPPMSTFTLGFITSVLVPLNQTEPIPDDKKSPMIRIWSRPQIKEDLAGIYERVHAYLKYLQNFWGANFPLSKLDIVVLPEATAVKSADNWGLIFLKESKSEDRLVVEIPYQWLGSWATPSLSSEEPLNKAIAEFLTTSLALEVDNDTELIQVWPLTYLHMLYYEYSQSYPANLDSTQTVFILRMLNYTMGPQTFKKGFKRFIADHQFKTFHDDDIWNALTKQGHADNVLSEHYTINNIVKSWISNNRLPVVTVTRNYNEQTAIVTQKVYIRDDSHDVPEKDNILFWIPLVLVDQNSLDFTNSSPTIWMEETREVTLKNLPASDKFIIVNPEEIGPFPVNYDKENWNLLANYLKTEEGRNKIPVFTKAKLIHDAWNLAYAGDLDFATVFNMVSFMKDERNPIVWKRMFTFFDHVGRKISSSKVHKKFQQYFLTLLKPIYEELKSEGDQQESWNKILRLSLRSVLLRVGYEPLVREVQTDFKKWMDQENPDVVKFPANRNLCPVFEYGTQEEYDFALDRAIDSPRSRDDQESYYLLQALVGCPKEKQKIEKILNMILEENGNFTDMDIEFILIMLTGDAAGYTNLFDFLSDNWDAIKIKFSSKPKLWDQMIFTATGVFKTQEGYDKVSALYVKHKGEFGSAEHIIEESLRTIKEQSKWSNENLPVMENWLDDYLKMFN